MRITLLAILAIALVIAGCPDKQPSNPVENRPPETHLFLVIGDSLGVPDPEGMPDTSASMLVLHWYGDDSDGEIIGFQWAWDDTSADTSWTFTDLVMDTFYVQIREVFNFFTFYIRAIDSDSAVDPTPASLTFPIINSPPTVRLPVALINDYSTEHNIMLGYHTFTWTGSDPDGNETISGYDIAIMDSSFHWDADLPDSVNFADLSWIHLDSLTFTYTFSDLIPGNYRMFLRAVDIAGSYSDVIYYPETTGVWEVIEANGEILYIDDNSYFTAADTMFRHTLNDLGLQYTRLNFQERPFYYTQDLELALHDFHILVYNAGYSRHFRDTAPAMTNFVNSGGHLMVNATYSSSDTTIYPFMPIDTIYDDYVQRPTRFFKQDLLNQLPGYPDTLQTSQPLSHAFGFAPKNPEGLNGDGYKVIYTIGETMGDPASVGDTVAVRFPFDNQAEIQEPAKLIFFSFPVFDCNVNNSFHNLFSHILLNEFADE